MLYVSAMMSFYVSAHKLCNDREGLQQRLSGVPPVVIDGLLERFTDKLRGSAESEMVIILSAWIISNYVLVADYASPLKTKSSFSHICLPCAFVSTTT